MPKLTKSMRQDGIESSKARYTVELQRDDYRAVMIGLAADLQTEQRTVNHLRSVVAALMLSQPAANFHAA
jgi:hypothetical protein